MNASIRTQVTFTEKEVIDILKAHLKRKGLVLGGGVSLMQGAQTLTICNVDDFQEPVPEAPTTVKPQTNYNDIAMALQDHIRRPGY